MNFHLHVSAPKCLGPILKHFAWLLLIATGWAAASPASGQSTGEDLETASERGQPVNVLLICIDDLRNELGYLGSPHAKTPQLDRFAKSAINFSRHYVQVPTCGASRAALMRSRYPDRREHLSNNAIAATQQQWAAQSLPGWFASHGYKTYSLGKVTHYPGNLSGPNWQQPPEELPGVWTRAWIPAGPWPHAEAMMHGYANGQARQRGRSPAIQAVAGEDQLYPDAWVATAAIEMLQELHTSNEPWLFAVGFFKPHLPFAAPQRWFDLHDPADFDPPPNAQRPDWPSGWHASGEFRGNYAHAGRDPETDPDYACELRRAYAAAVSYMDAQVGRLLQRLEELDPERRTCVVIWGDHGFLLGEHAIWGKHCLYEEALRSPLMIRAPWDGAGSDTARGATRGEPGAISDAIVETVDLLPTLADLCGLPRPPQSDGQSLRPWLEDPQQPTNKPALSFWTGGARSIRTERYRLIEHANAKQAGETALGPAVELFDYQLDPAETKNIAAEQPELVQALQRQLAARAPRPAGR